eukprot:TRINITY_DN28487_c0_g1_i1.p1 TRINITY_DN28487_c0_g1~~TRINITY_DN28487_c0_g1_i1.p1  ORF type:complete len:541 (+),score=81.91 TRINITY_DN28487_c0_g1_i1:164-1786(+)
MGAAKSSQESWDVSSFPSADEKEASSFSSRIPSSSPRSASPQQYASEYRIRFYNFNMANNSNFSIDELQGPGGRGGFLDALCGAFIDGSSADVSFATFIETRLVLNDWVEQYLAKHRHSSMDQLLPQNARREGSRHTRSRARSFVEGLAATYNGNLKSMLAFGSKTFKEDIGVFGRLTEREFGGYPVPNPKKAFMGRSLVAREGEGIRLVFVGAHFPISKLMAALEDPVDPLHGAKIALAKTLRRVLQKASRRNLADERTIIFVQGDLNSRTVLWGGEVHDALLEVLNDERLQANIQHQLSLPPGRWYELVNHRSANDLPVTYKFDDQTACTNTCSPETDSSPLGGHVLTIGNVIDYASEGGWEPSPPQSPRSPNADLYKRSLSSLGHERLAKCGLAFKQHDFRAFRFPACADRVIYWAPDALADRLSWELPRGGYEVNHSQLGSDHRPVSLEAVLRLSAKPIRTCRKLVTVGQSGILTLLTSDDGEGESDGFTEDDTEEGLAQPISPSPKAFKGSHLADRNCTSSSLTSSLVSVDEETI